MTARPRTKPPASVVAHPCWVLGVDPGESSGWSLWRHGRYVESGECGLWQGEPACVVHAVLGRIGREPLVACVERPFRVRYGTQMALGAADLGWRRALEAAGLGRRLVRVYPSTWRAWALGRGWGSRGRELTRARELEVATELVGRSVGADEAPAVLIGRWGCFAGESLAKVPKRFLPKGAA